MIPNVSPDNTTTTVSPYKIGTFDQYVTFCALGGLITSDEGSLSKMTTSQFCQQFGVNRRTTYRWRQSQGFGDKVRARREEIFPFARETACWNQLYLIGMQSKDLKAAVEAIKLLLGHFSGLKLPVRRQPEGQQNNNWADLINSARKSGIIDA